MAEISRAELKTHCIKEIDACKYFAKKDNTSLNDSRMYQEHKMVLDMIEKLEQIEKILLPEDNMCNGQICAECEYEGGVDCINERQIDLCKQILTEK